MLEGVLAPGGTASRGLDPRLPAGGQDRHREQDRPDDAASTRQSAYVASFVGFAPANDPKLLISVMVDEPHGGIYGGAVAAPAFGKIAQFALGYLKIAPTVDTTK